MEKNEELQAALESNSPITGSIADEIIVNLIDHCDDSSAAHAVGLTTEKWSALVQRFEEDIRHRVRNLR